jgi:hypothetical protein
MARAVWFGTRLSPERGQSTPSPCACSERPKMPGRRMVAENPRKFALRSPSNSRLNRVLESARLCCVHLGYLKPRLCLPRGTTGRKISASCDPEGNSENIRPGPFASARPQPERIFASAGLDACNVNRQLREFYSCQRRGIFSTGQRRRFRKSLPGTHATVGAAAKTAKNQPEARAFFSCETLRLTHAFTGQSTKDRSLAMPCSADRDWRRVQRNRARDFKNGSETGTSENRCPETARHSWPDW